MRGGFRVYDLIQRGYVEPTKFVLAADGVLCELLANHEYETYYSLYDLYASDRYVVEYETPFIDKTDKQIYENDILRIWFYEEDRADGEWVEGVIKWDNDEYVLFTQRSNFKERLEIWSDGSFEWFNISKLIDEKTEILENIHDEN